MRWSRMGLVMALELVGIVALAAFGVLIGFRISRFERWWIAVIPSFGFLALLVVCRFFPSLESWPPLRGRMENIVGALLFPILLIPLMQRLPHLRQRRLGLFATFAIVVYFSCLPFFGALMELPVQRCIDTYSDQDGVALQGTSYNCGAAAAVTLLDRMGIKADEGELAIACKTTRFTGTPVDLLIAGVSKLHGVEGTHITRKPLEHYDCPFIAVVKLLPMTDHYVVVLSFDESHVQIGDPLKGLETLTCDEFAERWRREGITFRM